MSSKDFTEAERNQREAQQRSMLLLAVRNENIAEVRRLIEAGAPRNCYREGEDPLGLAIQSRNQQMIHLLFQHDFRPYTDALGSTNLHWAAREGDAQMLKLLLDCWREKGYRINATFGMAPPPIHSAAQYGHLECVQLLEQAQSPAVAHAPDFDDKMTTLHAACESKSPQAAQVIRYLLSQGLDINAVDGSGKTPLWHAIRADNVGSIEELLRSPAVDLQMRNKSFGETYLHAAAYYNSLEIVQRLVAAGIDIHARSNSNASVIHRAAEAGRLDSMQWILANSNLQINERGSNGWTPLHYAASNNKAEVALFLLEQGADVTATSTPDNHTPLHLAAAYHINGGSRFADPYRHDHDPIIVNALIHHGADVMAPALQGLWCAAWENGEEMHQDLYPPDDDDDVPFEDFFPLHFAVLVACSANVVKALLTAGADIHARTSLKGSTPLHLAARMFSRGMLHILLENGADHQLEDNGGRKMVHHLQFLCRLEPEKIKEFLREEGIDEPEMERELDMKRLYNMMVDYYDTTKLGTIEF